MQVTVSMNAAGLILVTTPLGEILAECFFKAVDETVEGLRHMGYESLMHRYPTAHIVAGRGIEVADMEDLFLES